MCIFVYEHITTQSAVKRKWVKCTHIVWLGVWIESVLAENLLAKICEELERILRENS
jgi:hypothetical protein